MLVECLVLAFEFSRERGSFVLVCDFPDSASSADRSFAAFVFSGVRNFSREAGDRPELNRFDERFEARALGEAVVIQALVPRSIGEGGQLAMWFGPSFGGLQFSYDSVIGYQRSAVAEELDGDWQYRDAASGEEIDVYAPFPDLVDVP